MWFTIGELLVLINRKLNFIMATMQDLRDAVARNTSVDDSVLAMLEGISQQLKDAQAQNDPQAIQDVINQLDANTQKMTDAVKKNTVAENEPKTEQPVQ
jgi:flagellin-specific chaperone FliS